MPNSHKVSEHFQYLPPAEYSGHFLPSLPSQKHQQHKHTSLHQYQRPLVSLSVPSSSPVTMVPSEDVDRKLDRKSIARRQLVDTLCATQRTQGTKGLRRTHSCNYSSQSPISNYTTGGSGQNFNPTNFTTDTKRHGKPLWVRQNSFSNKFSAEKTREAIEHWNDLVLELHSEQYRQQLENQNHLAVLSETSSDDHKAGLTKDIKQPNGGRTLSLNKTDVKFMKTKQNPLGLGFTKYRPITPNLLDRLDKQKLPARRRTQLWVNQLPDERRSYHPRSSSLSEAHSPEEG